MKLLLHDEITPPHQIWLDALGECKNLTKLHLYVPKGIVSVSRLARLRFPALRTLIFYCSQPDEAFTATMHICQAVLCAVGVMQIGNVFVCVLP